MQLIYLHAFTFLERHHTPSRCTGGENRGEHANQRLWKPHIQIFRGEGVKEAKQKHINLIKNKNKFANIVNALNNSVNPLKEA